MTQEEWWAEIERHLLARDWNAVAVCADGLEESGDPESASTLRWICQKNLSTDKVSFRENIPTKHTSRWWVHINGGYRGAYNELREAVCAIGKERRQKLELWQ